MLPFLFDGFLEVGEVWGATEHVSPQRFVFLEPPHLALPKVPRRTDGDNQHLLVWKTKAVRAWG